MFFVPDGVYYHGFTAQVPTTVETALKGVAIAYFLSSRIVTRMWSCVAIPEEAVTIRSSRQHPSATHCGNGSIGVAIACFLSSRIVTLMWSCVVSSFAFVRDSSFCFLQTGRRRSSTLVYWQKKTTSCRSCRCFVPAMQLLSGMPPIQDRVAALHCESRYTCCQSTTWSTYSSPHQEAGSHRCGRSWHTWM